MLAGYSIRIDSLAVQVRECQDQGADGVTGQHTPYVSYFERDYERGMQHVLYPTCRFFKILDAQADREDTDEPDA